jgi:hypothetical protein
VLTALCLRSTADSVSRWSGGVLLVAVLDPPAEGLFADRWTPAGLYPLPPGPTAERIERLEARQPRAARALRRDRQTKELGVPVLADVVDETMLTSGRLPTPGQEELLADVGGRRFSPRRSS